MDEYRVGERYGETKFAIFTHATEVPSSNEGRFFLCLLERFAVIAAEPDGCDVAGRQQIKLLSPVALAERARGITQEAFATLRREGWMNTYPTIDEALEQLKGTK